MGIVNFFFHGESVFANEEMVGRHRDFCLCWKCQHFTPENRAGNCKIANALYALNLLSEITTPVFYCKEFLGKNAGATVIRKEE